MRALQSLSSLVFDLDGTLSDPSLGISRCFNYALEQHGYKTRDKDSLLQLIGPPLDAGFRYLLPDADHDQIEEMVATYRVRFSEVGFSENTIYPGIVEALECLKAHNVMMGICTSKREDFAIRILDFFKISDYFEFVSGGDIGITKSSQLSRLLEDHHIDRNAVMIGDRAVDITSAQSNNLQGIGVLWGFGAHQELAEANPAAILKSPKELECIVS